MDTRRPERGKTRPAIRRTRVKHAMEGRTRRRVLTRIQLPTRILESEIDPRARKQSGDPWSNSNPIDNPCMPRVTPKKFEG